MVTRRRNSALTEEKILEAALKLFSEQGYAATATSQIATRAEVSEGTVFKYFPKKIDLLRNVLLWFLEKYSAQIVLSPLEKIFENHKDDDIRVLLKAIIRDRVALLEKMAPFFKILLTEMQYYPELKDIFTEKVLKEMKGFGDKVFDTLYERGYIRELPSLIPIRSFVGSVALMAIQRKFFPEVTSEEMDLEKEIDWVIDIFLNGIVNQGGNTNEN